MRGMQRGSEQGRAEKPGTIVKVKAAVGGVVLRDYLHG